jgi:hypothetical protein
MTKWVEQAVLFFAWTALLLSPITMFIGHLGSHSLTWVQNQISTYAAQAPHDHWITAAMLLSALALLCIGLLVPAHSFYGQNLWSRMIAMVLGAAAAGLLLIAGFEETAPNLKLLQNVGFSAVRQQSFHDAGLLLFFYSALLALMMSGLIILTKGPDLLQRFQGLLISLCGPVAFLSLTTAWPHYIGFSGMTAGLKQRVAFLCLGFGFGLILFLMTKSGKADTL